MTTQSDTPDSSNAPNPDWEAIARYLAEESSAEEAEQVRVWLASHSHDASVVSALDRTLNRVAVDRPESVDVEAALAAVRKRRDNPEVLPLRTRTARAFPTPRASWRTNAMRIAAAIIVVAGATVLWQRSRREPSSTPIATTTAPKVYATDVGVRDSVRLSDGSFVVIGPKSRLVVPSKYGSGERSVEFQGEGYFDVIHDDAHGFVVRSGSALIRDVGTKFVVRNDDAANVAVLVREGAVLLGSNADSMDQGAGVVLHGGDVGELQQGGRPRVRRGAVGEDDMAWMSGRLVFRETPLEDVAAELRRWYGIELRVPDSVLAQRHLTATFAGESRQRVLQVISLALGASAELHGDTVVLRARGGGGNVDSGRRKPPSAPDAR